MNKSHLQICDGINILRKRTLPAPGKVLVRKGEWVHSRDIIATALPDPKFYSLDIARGLGVSRKDALGYLQFEEKEHVSKGNIIAGPVGLTKRVVRAPTGGKIVDIEDGEIIIQNSGKPHQLEAGLSGVIEWLIPGHGAVIKSTGAVVQGVWGNGLLGSGEMVWLVTHSNGELRVDQLGDEIRHKVIVGSYCGDCAVLETALHQQVRGLILASIPPDMLAEVSHLPIPVVILEGFGKMSINRLSVDLLKKYAGERVEIIAEPFDKVNGNRPEVIIPKDGVETHDFADMGDDLTVGQYVKITSPDQLGKIGKIIKVHVVTQLPNGFFEPTAKILFEDHSLITVPLANIEMVMQ